MEPMTFKTLIMLHCSLWSIHYSEIEYNRSGEPIALWPLHPTKVTPKRTDSGRLYYEVRQDDGSTVDLPANRMFRVMGMTLDGVTPLSVVSYARQSMELSIHAEEYGSAFFANSATPSGIITKRSAPINKCETSTSPCVVTSASSWLKNPF